jgi:hypothetical protein
MAGQLPRRGSQALLAGDRCPLPTGVGRRRKARRRGGAKSGAVSGRNVWKCVASKTANPWNLRGFPGVASMHKRSSTRDRNRTYRNFPAKTRGCAFPWTKIRPNSFRRHPASPRPRPCSADQCLAFSASGRQDGDTRHRAAGGSLATKVSTTATFFLTRLRPNLTIGVITYLKPDVRQRGE